MKLLILITTFVLSLFASAYIATHTAQALGLDMTPDGTIADVVAGVGFFTAFIATYVAGNLVEGQKLEVTLNVVGSSTRNFLFTIALVIGFCLAAWLVFHFISSTPIWALVIIVLLLLILMK